MSPEIADSILIDGRMRATRNSLGEMIDHSEEGLIAFWKWFGNGIVDDQRRPLVVFHGTRHKFDNFSRDVKISHPLLAANDNQVGFFFSANPGRRSDSGEWSGAAGYAGVRQVEGETVVPRDALIHAAYLSIGCPCKYESFGEYLRSVNRPQYRDEIEALGYDGVAVDGHLYIALEPSQIKSIHNHGRWHEDRFLADPEKGLEMARAERALAQLRSAPTKKPRL